jgi:hypothetical protein
MSKWYSQKRFPGAECMPVDGLQSLDQWKSAFSNPSGGKVLHMIPTLHSEMLNMSNLSAWSTECKSGTYFRRALRGESHTISQGIGTLLSYPFMPYVADGFGRRAAVFLGAIIMCGATVLQTASSSVGMFIGARCVPRELVK